jgi:hypothetical protein
MDACVRPCVGPYVRAFGRASVRRAIASPSMALASSMAAVRSCRLVAPSLLGSPGLGYRGLVANRGRGCGWARGYHATAAARQEALHNADMVAWHDGASVVESVTPNGLIVVNGVTIQGSVMVFPRLCLLWHVRGLEDVNESNLSLLSVYHPRPGATAAVTVSCHRPRRALCDQRVKRGLVDLLCRALHSWRRRDYACDAA